MQLGCFCLLLALHTLGRHAAADGPSTGPSTVATTETSAGTTRTSTETTTTTTGTSETFTAATTTTSPPAWLVPPPSPTAIETGLVMEDYDFQSGKTYIVAIDRSFDHSTNLERKAILKWTGLLQIRNAGVYVFVLTSLGKVLMGLDGQQILSVAVTGTQAESSTSAAFKVEAGNHSLVVNYEEDNGYAGISLQYSGPDSGGTMTLVPPEALWHAKGPCGLHSLVGVGQPACAPVGLALKDGESCEVQCQKGLFPFGNPHFSRTLSCSKGVLSVPNFECAGLPCTAPYVADSKLPSCQEGAQVSSGSTCTPQCIAGLFPRSSGPLLCVNGTLSTTFFCGSPRNCTVPNTTALNGAQWTLCAGAPTGSFLRPGDQCVPTCLAGFLPDVVPVCTDGALSPQVYQCLSEQDAAAREAIPGSSKQDQFFQFLHSIPTWLLLAGTAGLAFVFFLACFCICFGRHKQRTRQAQTDNAYEDLEESSDEHELTPMRPGADNFSTTSHGRQPSHAAPSERILTATYQRPQAPSAAGSRSTGLWTQAHSAARLQDVQGAQARKVPWSDIRVLE